MENETKYEQFDLMCFFDKLTTQFAIREIFYVPSGELKVEDLIQIIKYLYFHSQNISNKCKKQSSNFPLTAHYRLRRNKTKFAKHSDDFREDLAYSVDCAKRELNNWLCANNPEGKYCVFACKPKIFETKQDVFDEIMKITKTEYFYAGKISSSHKIFKKKILNNLTYNNSHDLN